MFFNTFHAETAWICDKNIEHRYFRTASGLEAQEVHGLFDFLLAGEKDQHIARPWLAVGRMVRSV